MIQQETEPFLVHSSGQESIVYADPRDPTNPNKYIQYQWDGNAWQVFAGPEANAIIPNSKENQLIDIKDGQIQSFGQGRVFSIQNTTTRFEQQPTDKSVYGKHTEQVVQDSSKPSSVKQQGYGI